MLDMVPRTESVASTAPIEEEDPAPLVTAHESAPDWLVFTEDGNTDGWLATRWTVDVRDYR